MTKIHDCFGKFCETAHLMPAFGGMLPNRIACALRDHLRGQRHVSTVKTRDTAETPVPPSGTDFHRLEEMTQI